MKPLLVLAGTGKQAAIWIKESEDVIATLKLNPKFLSPKDINYHGFKDGYFILVGTVRDAGYPPEMFTYFDRHNITNFNL